MKLTACVTPCAPKAAEWQSWWLLQNKYRYTLSLQQFLVWSEPCKIISHQEMGILYTSSTTADMLMHRHESAFLLPVWVVQLVTRSSYGIRSTSSVVCGQPQHSRHGQQKMIRQASQPLSKIVQGKHNISDNIPILKGGVTVYGKRS